MTATHERESSKEHGASEGQWCEWATIASVELTLVDPQHSCMDLGASNSTANARWIFFEDSVGMVARLSDSDLERDEKVKSGKYCEVIRGINSLPKRRRWGQQHTPDTNQQWSYRWPMQAPRFFSRMGPEAHFIPIHRICNKKGVNLDPLV